MYEKAFIRVSGTLSDTGKMPKHIISDNVGVKMYNYQGVEHEPECRIYARCLDQVQRDGTPWGLTGLAR